MPVTPSKLQVKINNANKTLTLIDEGQINILKTAALTDVEFDCMIPQVQYPFAVYKSGFQGAQYFLDIFEKLKTEEKYLEQGPLLGISALSEWPDEREDWGVYDAPAFFDLPLSVDLPEDLSEEELREQAQEGTELYERVKAQAKEYLQERIEQIISWYEAGEPLERIAVEVGLPEEVVANMVTMNRE